MKKEAGTFEKSPEIQHEVFDYGSLIQHEGVSYAITQDGEQGVPIPTDVADNIRVLFRLQDKATVDENPDAKIVMQTLNCRKSAMVASGVLDINKAILDSGDESGVNEMFSDINRLLHGGEGAVSMLKDYAAFEDELDSYEGSFPCIVHVFESDSEIDTEIIKERIADLHRTHSFLVLGQDDTGYVCFQKVGPAVDEPFTVTDLSFITHLYRNQKNRFGYFVYGPYRS